MLGALRVLEIAWDTTRVGRGDGDAIARRQQNRLADLVKHARSSSPYYRRLYHDLPSRVTDPQLLPPVRKPDLMAHFDEWVTDPDLTLERLRREFLSDLSLVGSLYLRRYHVFTTSGTTGEPAVLVHDVDSWAVLQVVARLRARRALLSQGLVRNALRRGLRWAVLFATGGHFGGVVLTESLRRRSSFMARRLRVFSVLRPVSELVEELNEFQPTVLNGYPSAIALMAAEQRAGRLRISPFLAQTSGEAMTAQTRNAITSAFGCGIVEGYAASEAPALAVQCPAGSLHVNADWYLLEPVDAAYRPVPPGETSHTTLVTNLANRVQPVIRYDLGDRVAVATSPCPCGSPLPRVTVEGRTNDVLSFESPDGPAVTVLPLALGTVIEETPGVSRFQAIRTGSSRLSVRLEMQPGSGEEEVWAAVDARLEKFFRDHGAAPVSVEHAAETPHADPRTGKFRQVWSA
ncbi:MAG TPA: phenylacetate--CoA ligase family protein [Nocardioidaceae bacterium]|nr:phenylacetate--CoA ligase family protein [Nocardioidaceae bacterium]